MQATFDRTQEDLGNSVGLEHLNLTIPDQQTAIAFYISGLGLTRDPYLVTGLENMWVNVGRSQFHLPIKNAQVVRGHTALVMPDLNALEKRLEGAKERLSKTKFGFARRSDYLEATCPWGNTLRCYAPDPKRFGPLVLGMAHIAFDVPQGAAAGIAQFYNKIIGAPATLEKTNSGASAKVLVGMNQHLIFNETSASLPPYDGHHIQLYVVNFSGPHRQLNERGLIVEESNQVQYRFTKIVDPDSGELLYELEHEIRSVTHPLYARPLLNRNPAQTNRDYKPGHDSLSWAMGFEE
ncbi:MAG: VOC family protein [Burkholderiales bacterium]